MGKDLVIMHAQAKFLSIYVPMELENKFYVLKMHGWDRLELTVTDIAILKGRKWKGKKKNRVTSLKQFRSPARQTYLDFTV